MELTGLDGLLTGLARQMLQAALEIDMADHLGYGNYDQVGRKSIETKPDASNRENRMTRLPGMC